MLGLLLELLAAITPIGSATFVIPYVLSSSKTPQVFHFLYLLYIYSEANYFL